MNRKLLFMFLGMTGVIILGAFVDRIGYVGVRRVQSVNDVVLQVSNPVVPGVVTAVRWDAPNDLVQQYVEIQLRVPSGVVVLGKVRAHDAVVMAPIPCLIDSTRGSIQMVNADTYALMSSVPVTILPLGPDCFR